ncbi:MAG TPA: VWA domain-containing protein [Terriglobales bacterium]|jgi:VWFA-related protein|nr:VWA domain-containing protein [Terriglobales bacterium]
MISDVFVGQKAAPLASCMRLILLAFVLLGMASRTVPAQAQDTSQQAPANPNQQEAPPEAGGPQNDVGPYVVPKKTDAPPPPAPEKPKKIENMPNYAISVDVPVVNLDVLVTSKDGQTVPGLTQENFKIIEDGAPQKIASFNQTQAPITAVLLIEFAAARAFSGSQAYHYMYDALNASYAFARTLKKDDWVAVESYDLKPTILVDFTQDKQAIVGALNGLRVPGFSERNLFDALFDTIDRIDRVEGRKYIILISSGADTFSRLTLDDILKKVKSTKDVTIYPVSIGWTYREMVDASSRGGGGMRDVTWAQNDNQMSTFARLTGGRAYFPRFEGELPEIFNQIGADIRNQYTISYHPTNSKLDGTYRKLKVELQAPDGGPLKVHDQKGKEVKYVVYAREGYTAKHTVE